ncbi:MAG TPA: M48 family metalloprotease [Anaerolineales bacterium]|nr:M48 family metalloprotease [Anaerolineales bacterium]
MRTCGFEGVWDPAAMPLFAVVMSAYGLITMPLGNLYSRWRERRADEYALKATGKGRAYASALTHLANQNLADTDSEPWVEFLLYSHPALGKRIRMAESGRQDILDFRKLRLAQAEIHRPNHSLHLPDAARADDRPGYARVT